MRLIPDWQYKYIEKCLYNFEDLKKSDKLTERFMVLAIEQAMDFFKDKVHVTMIEEFYFNVNEYRVRRNLTSSGQLSYICKQIIHLELSHGYIIRREIIYRIAMNCFASGLFKV